MTNEEYMSLALDLAREAAEHGEVPVGCVIADAAGRVIGRYDLHPHTLRHSMYVTLEPCPMCTGAIINSRIPCLVFGARDAVTGSCGSVIDLFFENYGHHPKVYAGVLGEESAELLRSFFKGLR